MLFFDPPYISDFLLETASRENWPVLDSPFARALAQKAHLNLVDEKEAIEKARAGEKLYSSSENSLAWIMDNLADLPVAKHIKLMKDKSAMRKVLQPLDADFFYRTISASRLLETDISEWPMPFVLKPATGFLSLGVHIIKNESDWKNASKIIEKEFSGVALPTSVLDPRIFIAEQYAKGEEYAVDLYFDDKGEPVILNIFKHQFASIDDVSDRLYLVSYDIVNSRYDMLVKWFREANRLMGVKNFPVHVELRIDGSMVRPIEFNPLRFAGLGGTDMAFHAFGVNTAKCWLEGKKPDLKAILRERENKIFSMILLDKRPSMPENAQMDFNRLARDFQKILQWRPMNIPGIPLFGFLFTETDKNNYGELERILHSDLREYV